MSKLIPLLLLPALIAGCPGIRSSSMPKPEPTPWPLTADDFSPAGQAVLEALQGWPASEGVTWSASADSTFDAGWIVQSPEADHWGLPAAAFEEDPRCEEGPGCDPDFLLRECATDSDCTEGGLCRPLMASVTAPGQEPSMLCTGHSDVLIDEVHAGIIEGVDRVDLSSLTEPDGRFLVAVRNGLTYLHNAGRAPTVRLLFGAIPGMFTDPDQILEDLTADLPSDSPVEVHVGAWQLGYTSWNHAKIVAADGDHLLQGGHNLWTEDYLGLAPVHDLSMTVRGTPAEDAHRFLDAQWELVCEDYWFSGWTGLAASDSAATVCPGPLGAPLTAPMAQPGASRVISMGRLGAIGEDPSDAALEALMRSAQSSIRLSLQDLGPIRIAGPLALSGWPGGVLGELARAADRGVQIELVLSNPGSRPGANPGYLASYDNGWSVTEVMQTIETWIANNPGVVSPNKDVHGMLCDQVSAAPLRFDADDEWSTGAGIGNHSKAFIVDDATFYIGSQNLYVADLAEWGLVVDDPAITAELLADYWNPLWAASSVEAVSGPNTACTF